MSSKNASFAFVLVKTPPDRAEVFDPLWRYTVPYMRFRHPDVQARHWVLCVRDALTILDSSVTQKGARIAEIHLYSHANPLGSVWGRLQSPKETYRALTLDDVTKFRHADTKVRAVAAKTDQRTRLYFHGCNLGKSPQALVNWRDALGVTRGLACAPDMFQHFCAGALELGATCPDGTSILKRQASSMADIERYIADVIARASDACGQLHPAFAAQFRKRVLANLDAYLARMFKKLKQGDELPPDVASLSNAKAIERMRALFEQAKGVPITFLGRHLLSGPVLGNACDEEILKKTPGLDAVFPWHTAQWKNHHHWEPHAPHEGPP